MSENKNCCCSRGREGSCGKQDKSCGGCSGGCSSSGSSTGSGCGCSGGGCQDRTIYITEDEKVFLSKLAEIPFLPLARFVMKRSADGDNSAVAMAPVYLESEDDAAETVKNNGNVLQSLEDKYLITLDYDLPLKNGDYAIYEKSRLYRDFSENVIKGVTEDGVTYDLPVLERGSMALTTLGQDALDNIE